MNQELYKTRNVSSCVGAAYNLFVSNITKIACRLWMPILAFSVVYVLMSNTRLYLLLHVDELQQDLGMLIGMWAGNLFLNLLLLCTVTWNVSALMSRLNSFGLKQNLRRGFVLIGVVLCVSVACTLFFAGIGIAGYLALAKLTAAPTVVMMVMGIVVIAFLCLMVFFLLPLNFISMKYFMEGGKLFASLKKWYRLGMRHVGLLFAAMLISLILFCVLAFVFGMPQYVLIHAQIASIAGTSMGDVTTLPSCFNLMMGGASFIFGLFVAFFMLWNTLLNYYVYGSIEQSERERLKTKMNEQ